MNYWRIVANLKYPDGRTVQGETIYYQSDSGAHALTEGELELLADNPGAVLDGAWCYSSSFEEWNGLDPIVWDEEDE